MSLPTKDWKGPFKQGVELFKQGDYKAALSYFDEAIKTGAQKSIIVLDSRAATYEKLGDMRKALEDAKMCVKLEPNSSKGFIRGSKILEQLGQLERSIEMLSRAIRLSPPTQQASLQTKLTALREKADSPALRKLDPVQVLPSELMSLVLTYAATSASSPDFAIGISHVSKGWRAAALDTKGCWGRLKLGRKMSAVKVKTWLERSGEDIKELDLLCPVSVITFNKLAKQLLPILPGLEVLKLDVTSLDYRGFLDDTLQPWRNSLVKIRELYIIAGDSDPFCRWDAQLLSSESESLRILSVNGGKDTSTISLGLPVLGFEDSQLASLHTLIVKSVFVVRILAYEGFFANDLWPATYLSSGPCDSLHAILAKAPNLQKLVSNEAHSRAKDLTQVLTRQEWLDLEWKVNLPKLEYVEVGSSGSCVLEGVKNARIVHLYLLDILDRSPKQLSQYWGIDFGQLTSFSLKDCSRARYLVNILARLRSVRNLCLGQLPDNLAISTLDNQTVCPLLESLHILKSPITSSPIMKLVSNRMKVAKAFAQSQSQLMEMEVGLNQGQKGKGKSELGDGQGVSRAGAEEVGVKKKLGAFQRLGKTASASSTSSSATASSSFGKVEQVEEGSGEVSKDVKGKGKEIMSEDIKVEVKVEDQDQDKKVTDSEDPTEKPTPPSMIRTLILEQCPNIEKQAEEWLRANVEEFRLTYPPVVKAGYRDKFGR